MANWLALSNPMEIVPVLPGTEIWMGHAVPEDENDAVDFFQQIYLKKYEPLYLRPHVYNPAGKLTPRVDGKCTAYIRPYSWMRQCHLKAIEPTHQMCPRHSGDTYHGS